MRTTHWNKWFIISLVVMLSMIFAACAPTPTPAPTAAPAPTQAPTKAPEATKAPAATTAPTAVPATGKPLVIAELTERLPPTAKRVIFRDDIFAPDIEIYKNASLIYSIRPPVDFQEAMAGVAKEAGADLLIRPFGNEKAGLERYFKECKLVNYRKARFYLYR